jgi:mitofusin
LYFTGGALAEGFQARLQEFQNFEQIFEVGIFEVTVLTSIKLLHWLE